MITTSIDVLNEHIAENMQTYFLLVAAAMAKFGQKHPGITVPYKEQWHCHNVEVFDDSSEKLRVSVWFNQEEFTLACNALSNVRLGIAEKKQRFNNQISDIRELKK